MSKGVNVEDLAKGIARDVIGEKGDAPNAVTFTIEEVDLLLGVLRHVTLTPALKDLVRKLAKAKVTSMIRKGLGLKS